MDFSKSVEMGFSEIANQALCAFSCALDVSVTSREISFRFLGLEFNEENRLVAFAANVSVSFVVWRSIEVEEEEEGSSHLFRRPGSA